MVIIDCPWCQQDEPLDLKTAQEPQASFTCPDCGTSVQFVEEPLIALDPAA
ncbi:MAG: hypothetical protein ACC726_01380 [Chloroflexota bacterium]